jgi:uncharacterized membrane protein YqaE (UPF0057 family)
MSRKFVKLITVATFAAFMVNGALATSVDNQQTTTSKKATNNQTIATEAKTYFKNLSSSQRKENIKEAKKVVKDFKQNKKQGKFADTDQLLLVILAVLVPPLAVYLHEGEINGKFWLDLLLTLLFYLPGLIYALIVIL